jgi:hypothetical protein
VSLLIESRDGFLAWDKSWMEQRDMFENSKEVKGVMGLLLRMWWVWV